MLKDNSGCQDDYSEWQKDELRVDHLFTTIDHGYQYKTSLLHLASIESHLGVAKLLIKKGANPLLKSDEGYILGGIAVSPNYIQQLLKEADASHLTRSDLCVYGCRTHSRNIIFNWSHFI